MARKEDRKKQKKRKKEALKARKREARDEFPRTEIAFDGEDDEFMLAVEQIVHTFDYANDKHCPGNIREMYRFFRKAGIEHLEARLHSEEFEEYAENNQIDAEGMRALGRWALFDHLRDWIFKQLPEKYTKYPLPSYFFNVQPEGRGFVVSFKYLPRIEIGMQRVWHSPFEPTVEIAGRSYRVGYTRHVFERACERMTLRQPIVFLNCLGVAEYFRRCVYFEHVALQDGQDALRLFAPCVYELGEMYLYTVAGMKPSDVTASEWSFVLGYCPVEVSSTGFAIVKTLLFPGYKNTPEAAQVNRTRIHHTLLSRLRAAAQDNTLGAVFMDKNLDHLRWYHHNGVPQVVRLPQPLFRLD